MNNQPQYGGEAGGYYNQQPPPQQYSQAPPNYGQNYGAPQQNGYGAPYADGYDGGKPTFDQQFKVEKPKWNDVSL